MSRDDELERVKAHLRALSASLPELIERIRAQAALEGRLPDPEKERQRLAAFANYLDHYGRMDARTFGPVNLRDVVEEAVALTRAEVERKAQLGTSYLDAPLVRGNPRQLGHVFVALLINAAQAIQHGTADENYVEVELDTSPQGHARVAIADSGAGISPDDLPHIFQPLYSTKRGTTSGVGLAVVREIINGLGGTVTVESASGSRFDGVGGTLFIVELPAAS
ncbi:MAG TPA: HAMP domain-containing sensor histidine kinase [Kofleriaceae bacterium]